MRAAGALVVIVATFAACGFTAPGGGGGSADPVDPELRPESGAEAATCAPVGPGDPLPADASPSDGKDVATDASSCDPDGERCSREGAGSCCTGLYCRRGILGSPDRCEACHATGSGCSPNGANAECCKGTCSGFECD